MKPRVLVIDGGFGNVGSIANMVKKAGGEALISSDGSEVKEGCKLILPGVGSFDNGIRNLKDSGLWDVLSKRVLQDKIPILGICLGMQIFFEGSEEGQLSGFGWISGRSVRFKFDANLLKVPHMGWNYISIKKKTPLFDGLGEGTRFYFAHSYHITTQDEDSVASTACYGYDFVSSVQKNNIYATQFHPEKSHHFGLKLISNFLYKC